MSSDSTEEIVKVDVGVQAVRALVVHFPLSTPPPPSDTASKALSCHPRRLCAFSATRNHLQSMHRPGNRPSSREAVGMFSSRAGQPPQRPPSLGPNPALGAAYRGGPYAGYGLPQRNVMQGYPSLPTQRTVVPQPSPNFLQQRGQNNFPFNAGTLQQQQAQAQSQLTSQASLSHAAHQQQTQGSGANSTLPLHLAQNAAPSSLAPSVSSQSELGLDPNDFPALGTAPASSTPAPSNANAASYATQAGTGAGGSGGQTGNGIGATPARELTAEDFPALGGQSQTTQQQSQASQQAPADGHPPGLNGFQQHTDPQHRQNLLGSLTSGSQQQQQQQPGLLNLGQQARNVHPGFQSDADKQRVCPSISCPFRSPILMRCRITRSRTTMQMQLQHGIHRTSFRTRSLRVHFPMVSKTTPKRRHPRSSRNNKRNSI